jgi:hypothetical protein
LWLLKEVPHNPSPLRSESVPWKRAEKFHIELLFSKASQRLRSYVKFCMKTSIGDVLWVGGKGKLMSSGIMSF